MDGVILLDATALLGSVWSDWFSGAGAWSQVVIGIGLVIFVHELGHFLAAKACGVKCEKFYVGFDVPIRIGPLRLPRSLVRFQWGETEYGIGVIPLGGYVKMLGQDDNPTRAAEEAERVRQTGADAAGEEIVKLDPRSFPAKTVWQRMLIISAGVIMNLIFAVIFGAVAYRMGVKYIPCEVSAVRAGDPAWIAGISPGDKIVRLTKEGENDEFLRFNSELRPAVFKYSLGKTQEQLEPMPIRVQRGGEILDFQVTPRAQKIGASLGVFAPQSNVVAQVIEGFGAAASQPPLAAGDRVVAIDGVKLDTSLANEEGEFPCTQIDTMMAENFDRDLTFTVQRIEGKETKTLDVVVPPTPLRSLGMVMEMGPIMAIRAGSSAESAGIRVGDVILNAQGEKVADPMRLPELAVHWGDTVQLRVRRGEGDAAQEIDFVLNRSTKTVPLEHVIPGSHLTLSGLGLAYNVLPIVARVESGGPADQAGVQAGDQVTVARLNAEGEALHKQAVEHFQNEDYNELQELDDQINWPYIQSLVQSILPGMDIDFTLMRGGERVSARLRPITLQDQFYPDRGLFFGRFERVHRTADWSEAFSLGARETEERVEEVATVLWYLISGRAPFQLLGGPITIAKEAKSQASHGTAQLLIFLTLLSANLALLNFLPIPALDGGHMVFLICELVRGKPVDERWQQTLTMIGVLCLLGLMAAVLFNDIIR